MPDIVMVRSFDIRKTRNQDSYGSLRLNTGRAGNFAEVDAKLWGLDGFLSKEQPLPATGDLIEVSYRADDYQGRPQWILQNYRILGGAERTQALVTFTPLDKIDREFYRQRLEELIDRTQPERAVGAILREIFDRPAFREAFYLAPAARDFHQNYPGGLLEHTVNVTTLALSIADAYASPAHVGLSFNRGHLPIDRDVLIAAGLLHDIGKIETYAFAPLPECTETNTWEGHLVLGYFTTRRIAEPLLSQPPYPGAADEINKLLHCILSHHGQMEFGSPVIPACAEAFILSQADMTDARLAEIAAAGLDLLQRDPQSRWVRNHIHFRNGLFLGDWNGLGEAPLAGNG